MSFHHHKACTSDYFLGMPGTIFNLVQSSFKLDGVEMVSSEQGYQAQEAVERCDTYGNIMSSIDSQQCKHLGGQVAKNCTMFRNTGT